MAATLALTSASAVAQESAPALSPSPIPASSSIPEFSPGEKIDPSRFFQLPSVHVTSVNLDSVVPAGPFTQPSPSPVVAPGSAPSSARALTGTFTVRNGEKTATVSDLHYQVLLLGPAPIPEPDGTFVDRGPLYDRSVHADTFSVLPGTEKVVPFTYLPPSLPEGDYRLRIRLITSHGWELGWYDQTVRLGDPRASFILLESGAIELPGGKLAGPAEGPNVPARAVVTLHGVAKNVGPETLEVTPRVETFAFEVTGEKVSETTRAPLTIRPGEEVKLDIPAAAPERPGAYAVIVTLHNQNGDRVSSPAAYRLVVMGASARVVFAKFETLGTASGAPVVISVDLVGPADRTATVQARARVELLDGSAVVGSQEIAVELGSSAKTIKASYTLEKRLAAPGIKVRLQGPQGELFDEYAFAANLSPEEQETVATQSRPGSPLSRSMFILLALIVILVLLSLLLVYLRHPRSRQGVTTFVVLCLLSGLAVWTQTHRASANGIHVYQSFNPDPLVNDNQLTLFINRPIHEGTYLNTEVPINFDVRVIACNNVPFTGDVKLYRLPADSSALDPVGGKTLLQTIAFPSSQCPGSGGLIVCTFNYYGLGGVLNTGVTFPRTTVQFYGLLWELANLRGQDVWNVWINQSYNAASCEGVTVNNGQPVIAGQEVPISVTFKNTGNRPWVTDGGPWTADKPKTHTLLTADPDDLLGAQWWWPTRVTANLSGTLTDRWDALVWDVPGHPVVPGASATFAYTALAPTVPRTYTAKWSLREEGAATFPNFCGPTNITVVAGKPDLITQNVTVSPSSVPLCTPSSVPPCTPATIAATIANIGENDAASSKASLKANGSSVPPDADIVALPGSVSQNAAGRLDDYFNFSIGTTGGVGTYFLNSYGLGEKWLWSLQRQQWYLILTNGELRRWQGNATDTLKPGALVAKLDSSFFTEPTKIWFAAGRASPASLSLTDLASRLEREYDFTPGVAGYRTNELGLGEKWLQSRTLGAPFILLSTGELRIWLGSGSGEKVATLDASYYQDPSLLWAPVAPGTTSSLAARAYAIDQDLDLTIEKNGYYVNWSAGLAPPGLEDKWMISRKDTPIGPPRLWYMIRPNGELWQWKGTGGGSITDYWFITTLADSYYTDPSLLWAPVAPGTTASLAARASALDADLDFTMDAGGYYTGTWNGLGSKWMIRRKDMSVNPADPLRWYIIRSNGELWRWKGAPADTTSLTSYEFVTTLDASYYTDPSLLWAPVAPGTTASLAARASALDADLDLTMDAAGYYTSSSGLNYKWMISRKNKVWYVLLPSTGELKLWKGGTNFESVTTLDASYYQDPSLLWAPVAPGTTASLAARASALDADLDFTMDAGGYYTGTWNGLGSKWMIRRKDMSVNPADPLRWYIIRSNGELWRWKGAPADTTSLTSYEFVTTLDASYYQDPSLLWAPVAPNLTVSEATRATALDADFGLKYLGTYCEGALGMQERRLGMTTSVSCADTSGFLVVLPNGELRMWGGSAARTLTSDNLIGTFNSVFYTEPARFWKASPPVSPPPATPPALQYATSSTPVSFSWTPSQGGDYTMSVCADSVNTVVESDETNNCAQAPLVVAQGSLRVTDPTPRCSPLTQQTVAGQDVTLTAQPWSGNGGPYNWSAPDGTPVSGTGSSFTTKYSTLGPKPITITSGAPASAGLNSTCTVDVIEGGFRAPRFQERE